MQFTGKNLDLVRYGLSLAVDEFHNQIVTCPDVIEYGEDLAEIKAEKVIFEKLIARIDRAKGKP